MNNNKELKKKEKELKIVNNIMAETLIMSQQKYEIYQEEQRKIEAEIREIKAKEPKIIKTWIDIEGGWKKRIYKNE